MKECGSKTCKLDVYNAGTKIHHYSSLDASSGSYVAQNWGVLIVTSGIIEFRINKKDVVIKENEMIIIPVYLELQVTVKKGFSGTFFDFYDSLFASCKVFIYEISQKDYQVKTHNRLTSLKVHSCLLQMLAVEQSIFFDGKSNIDTDYVFINFWFMMLRKYYMEEELINFFSLMNVRNIHFKSYILLHYKNKDVSMLADECNMSVSTFNRYFRTNFGESALQWLNKKKADLIYQELLFSRKSFSEIAYDNNFSSTSYLTAFCKRYFKRTPDQIRRQLY